MKKYLPRYQDCFVCGDHNKIGLKRRFYVNKSSDELIFEDEVVADITFAKDHEGFKGVVHGGVITALIDEAMGWASTINTKKMYVTAEINVVFIKPARVGEPLKFIGRMIDTKRRVTHNEGVVLNEAGETVVKATGRFYALSDDDTKKVKEYLSFEDAYDVFL